MKNVTDFRKTVETSVIRTCLFPLLNSEDITRKTLLLF